jgi:hypothetical protein
VDQLDAAFAHADLHGLVGELLVVVERDEEPGVGRGGGEEAPLDARGVHGVAVDEHRSLRVVLAGGPQRVGVVPVRLVVVDDRDGDAVPLLEDRGVLADLLGGVAHGDREVEDADLGQAAHDRVEDRLRRGDR